MEPDAITEYLATTFEHVDVLVMQGNTFCFYQPDPANPDHKFPFVTLVTDDSNDTASNLERPNVFRLNIGVSRDTYTSMFGPHPAFPKDGGIIDTGHDFTALDLVMPHPVYAAMSWICVLNPSVRTFETLEPLLAEAYRIAVRRHDKRIPSDHA